jgi:hypothetical protein
LIAYDVNVPNQITARRNTCMLAIKYSGGNTPRYQFCLFTILLHADDSAFITGFIKFPVSNDKDRLIIQKANHLDL